MPSKEYRLAHKDHMREYLARYYQEHKKEITEKTRMRRAKKRRAEKKQKLPQRHYHPNWNEE